MLYFALFLLLFFFFFLTSFSSSSSPSSSSSKEDWLVLFPFGTFPLCFSHALFLIVWERFILSLVFSSYFPPQWTLTHSSFTVSLIYIFFYISEMNKGCPSDIIYMSFKRRTGASNHTSFFLLLHMMTQKDLSELISLPLAAHSPNTFLIHSWGPNTPYIILPFWD